MRQYREARDKHPDGILLFRLGDFYEIFFDDARVAAPIMGVQLTSRPLGKTGRAPLPRPGTSVFDVPLSAVPFRWDRSRGTGVPLHERTITRALGPVKGVPSLSSKKSLVNVR